MCLLISKQHFNQTLSGMQVTSRECTILCCWHHFIHCANQPTTRTFQQSGRSVLVTLDTSSTNPSFSALFLKGKTASTRSFTFPYPIFFGKAQTVIRFLLSNPFGKVTDRNRIQVHVLLFFIFVLSVFFSILVKRKATSQCFRFRHSFSCLNKVILYWAIHQ